MSSRKYISSYVEFEIENFFQEAEKAYNDYNTSKTNDTTKVMTYRDYSYFKAEYEQPHIKIIPLDAEAEGISFKKPKDNVF